MLPGNILLRRGKLSGYLISLLDQNSTWEPEAFFKFFFARRGRAAKNVMRRSPFSPRTAAHEKKNLSGTLGYF